MALPEDYWASFEATAASLAEVLDAVRMISAYQARTGARFAWRGVSNARWPLYSSVVRAYLRRNRNILPTERQLRVFEATILGEARSWGLDWHSSGGLLTALELLAALQHYGVPTRLVDFTFSPLIALWFAAEGEEEEDGRLFAIDISTRPVDRLDAESSEPWWLRIGPGAATAWTKESWVWIPPPFEPRIVRQQGCFLMGGIPSTQPQRSVRRGRGWRLLRANEVRACMSLPFRLITYQQAVSAFAGQRLRGQPPRAFTLRVRNKREIRKQLDQAFDLSHRSLFPDFPGLRQYGRSFA